MNVVLNQLTDEASFNTILPLVLSNCNESVMHDIFYIICMRGYVGSFDIVWKHANLDTLFTHPHDVKFKNVSKKLNAYHIVCKEGHLNLLNRMLEVNSKLRNDVYIAMKCGWGSTPLLHACENGHLEVVKILVENGADINTHGSSKNSCTIVQALKSENNDLVTYLGTLGLNANNYQRNISRAHAIIKNGDFGKLDEYVAARDEDYNQQWKTGALILLAVNARYNNCDIVEHILSKYDVPNTTRSENCSTLLGLACETRCARCIRLLLAKNLGAYSLDGNDTSLWGHFYDKYDSACVGALLEYFGTGGRNFMLVTGEKENEKLINVLLKHNDVDLLKIALKYVKTPLTEYLEYALKHGSQSEVLRLFLRCGVSYDEYVNGDDNDARRMQPLIIEYLRDQNIQMIKYLKKGIKFF